MAGICTSAITQAVLESRPECKYSAAEAKVAAAKPSDRIRSPVASRAASSSSITEIIEGFANFWSLVAGEANDLGAAQMNANIAQKGEQRNYTGV